MWGETRRVVSLSSIWRAALFRDSLRFVSVCCCCDCWCCLDEDEEEEEVEEEVE